MLYAFLPYITLALFLVVLTGSNGVGIALSMGYYIAENVIVVPILDAFSWAERVFTYLLGPNVGAWQNTPPNNDGNIATFGGIPDMAHGFIIVTIYAAVLAAVALTLFLRRDISGAKGG